MTRRIVVLTAFKNVCWKATKIYIAHYRMKYPLELYNVLIWPLIDLYRKTELEIDNDEKRYNKFQYYEKIKQLEKETLKKFNKGNKIDIIKE